MNQENYASFWTNLCNNIPQLNKEQPRYPNIVLVELGNTSILIDSAPKSICPDIVAMWIQLLIRRSKLTTVIVHCLRCLMSLD